MSEPQSPAGEVPVPPCPERIEFITQALNRDLTGQELLDAQPGDEEHPENLTREERLEMARTIQTKCRDIQTLLQTVTAHEQQLKKDLMEFAIRDTVEEGQKMELARRTGEAQQEYMMNAAYVKWCIEHNKGEFAKNGQQKQHDDERTSEGEMNQPEREQRERDIEQDEQAIAVEEAERRVAEWPSSLTAGAQYIVLPQKSAEIVAGWRSGAEEQATIAPEGANEDTLDILGHLNEQSVPEALRSPCGGNIAVVNGALAYDGCVELLSDEPSTPATALKTALRNAKLTVSPSAEHVYVTFRSKCIDVATASSPAHWKMIRNSQSARSCLRHDGSDVVALLPTEVASSAVFVRGYVFNRPGPSQQQAAAAASSSSHNLRAVELIGVPVCYNEALGVAKSDIRRKMKAVVSTLSNQLPSTGVTVVTVAVFEGQRESLLLDVAALTPDSVVGTFSWGDLCGLARTSDDGSVQYRGPSLRAAELCVDSNLEDDEEDVRACEVDEECKPLRPFALERKWFPIVNALRRNDDPAPASTSTNTTLLIVAGAALSVAAVVAVGSFIRRNR